MSKDPPCPGPDHRHALERVIGQPIRRQFARVLERRLRQPTVFRKKVGHGRRNVLDIGLGPNIVEPDVRLTQLGRHGIQKDAHRDPGIVPDPQGVGHGIGVDAEHKLELGGEVSLKGLKAPLLFEKLDPVLVPFTLMNVP